MADQSILKSAVLPASPMPLLFWQIQTRTFKCDCCDRSLVDWSLAIIARRRKNDKITVNHIYLFWSLNNCLIILRHTSAHWPSSCIRITSGLVLEPQNLLQNLYQYNTLVHTEQQKVLQRSSAAASWARALWAERGCCTQIRRAIGSLREQERARGSQREQESKPERARERLASHLKHASTLFCCKTVKYNSVLS